MIALGVLGCGGSNGASPQDGGTTLDTGSPPEQQDGGTMLDTAAPPTDAFTASMIPVGEHFCQITNTGEAIWLQGYETACRVTAATNPPLTAAQKQAADEACVAYPGPTVVPRCPPRDDVIGFCAGGLPAGGNGTRTWTLVYRSSVTPDAEALSLGNGPYCPEGQYDLNGRKIAFRSCVGSVTARVNGVMTSFNVHLACGYRSDGTRSRYVVMGDTGEIAPVHRLVLEVTKTGTTVAFDENDPNQPGGAVYQDDANGGIPNLFINSQTTVNATTFLERGGGLVATFSLGTSDAVASVPAVTITEGAIDIRLVPAP